MTTYKIKSSGLNDLYKRLQGVSGKVRDETKAGTTGPDRYLTQDDMTLWLKNHSTVERNSLYFFAERGDGLNVRIGSLASLSLLYGKLIALDEADGVLDGKISNLPQYIRLEISDAGATQDKPDIATNVRPLMDGVFRIAVTTRSGGDWAGSAWVVERKRLPDGKWKYWCITNAHVIDDLDEEIERYLTDTKGRNIYSLDVIGVGRSWDVGVFTFTSENDYPVLPVDESANQKAGDEVAVVGNQHSNGIIMALGYINDPHKFASQDGRIPRRPIPMIHFDSNGGPGTSGGPLLNSLGHVIGLSASRENRKWQSENIFFAIPSELAMQTYRAIKDRGHHTHGGHLNAEIASLPPMALKQIGLKENRGVYISYVRHGSVASMAGLRAGDILLSIDGEPVPFWSSLDELHYKISRKNPGDTITFEIVQAHNPKNRMRLEYRVQPYSESRVQSYETPFGFTAVQIDEQTRREIAALKGVANPDEIKGVMVIHTETDSDENKSGMMIKPPHYSIITEMDGRRISSVEEFKNLIETRRSRLPIVFRTLDIENDRSYTGRESLFLNNIPEGEIKWNEKLGIGFVELNETQKKAVGINPSKPAIYVTGTSPAESPDVSPLFPGDIITGYNGKDISSLNRFTDLSGKGTEYSFQILRNGRPMEVARRLDVFGRLKSENYDPYSFEAVDLTPKQKVGLMYRDETYGVYIAAAPKNGAGRHPYQLEAGMIVTMANGVLIKSKAQLIKIFGDARRFGKPIIYEASGSLGWKYPGYKTLLSIPAHTRNK